MALLDLSKTTPMLDLSKAAPSLRQVRGLLNWDPHPSYAGSLSVGFDLDIFAFVLNAQGKVTSGSDVVFFNNKKAHGVHIPKDNRTGEGKDDEELLIALPQVPSDKTAIEIFVFLHDAVGRKQTFGMISNATFSLIDADTGHTIQSYRLTDMVTETAVHIGSLARNASGWGFQPIGDANTMDPNQVAQAFM